ncbi:MAG: hypothetical protein ABI861_10970 [Panacibacter sp.]
MRFSTAYYLFLLYLTVVLQPLVPIICDAVAHTFEDAVHVATVHAKYGDNHREVELANTSSDNDNNKNHNAVKADEQIPVHFGEDEYTFDYTMNNILTKYFPANLFDLSIGFIAKHSPPPKFS